MNILKQVEELQKKIDELKAQCEKQEPIFELPAIDNEYHSINTFFSVDCNYYGMDAKGDSLIELNNAFTDKAQAEACAKHLRDTFWFTRKAIEFADSYEFVVGANNYYQSYMYSIGSWVTCSNSAYQQGTIYMAKESAVKFCGWLNKHKPNGWK